MLVLLDQAIVSGGNFALGLILVRTMGLDNYGLFTVLWMGVLFILNLHQAFITKPMMTLAVKLPEVNRPDYFFHLFLLQLFLGMLIIELGAMVSVIAPSFEGIQYAGLVSIVAVVYCLQDFIRKIFFIQKRNFYPVLSDGILYGVLFLSIVIFYYNNTLTIETLLGLVAGAYSLGILVVLIFAFPKLNTLDIQKSKNIFISHFHFSQWLLGTSILQWFTGNFFLVAAAGVLGTAVVGAIRIGQNIIGLSHVLFLAMENIVPAEAARHHFQNGNSALFTYIKKITLKLGAAFIGIIGTMTLFAPWLLELFYGTGFATHTEMVWGYALLYVFVFFGFPLRYILRTWEDTKPIFFSYILSAGFCFFAAHFFLENFGVVGYFSGLILSQIIINFVYVFYVFKKIPKTESLKFEESGL